MLCLFPRRRGLFLPSAGGDRKTKDRNERLLAFRGGSSGLAPVSGSSTHLCHVADLPAADALVAVSSGGGEF